jgi:Tol biopolymer transport system component/tRNA A-37 threonylcarbamoyl transferase component Bud32
MALISGDRVGPYEIVAAIGAGGMGEVYRARDTKLGRDVALKVLPDLFANDPDRLMRFEREAKTLAALNHPHIAQIYGLEDTGTVRALVMELVEGDDLSAIIARHGRSAPAAAAPSESSSRWAAAIGGGAPRAIEIDDALRIARQLADALDYAHEHGVMHRDLKPANIKVTPDGAVKVLDFGLAKALTADGADSVSEAMHSPTMTARATQMGVILGTAAYMAPEQAKGKAADRRADVWAFGVVLFEMITGQQLFTGETGSEVMASVMKEEPDWSRLPSNLPASLRRLLRRCLEKDPKKRLSSISDARLELGEPEGAVGEVSAGPARGSRLALAASALIGITLTAAAFLFVVPAFRPAPDRPPARVSVLGPEGVTLNFDSSDSAISPDGRLIVFTVVDRNGANTLWVRPIGELEAHQLAGTEEGHLPFWSPDSREIAFFTGNKLKKIFATGGTVQPIGDVKDARGGSWGSENAIVFAPSNNGPLQSVSASGGDPKTVTTLDAARGHTGHRFPWFLPDGRHFLYAALPQKEGKFDLYVGSLDASAGQAVTSAECAAVYAEPGYLLFSRKGVLVAQRFDARRLQLSGEPLAIGEAPASMGGAYTSSRAASVSATGALAYLGDKLANTKLVWFDRSGRQVGGVTVPPGNYSEVSFAPDGRRAAVVLTARPDESDIWIADLERGGATRFTFGPSQNNDVHWSPDGSRIVFASKRDGPRDVFVKPASGATTEEPLFKSKTFADPSAWSADGKFVVFDGLDAQTNRDLWVLPADGKQPPTAYLRTPFNEVSGEISPDGRFMVYSSDESGRFEIYVDTFPIPRNKYRVTENGGNYPHWRRDGKELMTISSDSRSVWSAEVIPGAEFKTAAPRQVLTLPRGTVWVQPTPDFQKFLVSTPVADNTTSSLTVVFDWLGALGKK